MNNGFTIIFVDSLYRKANKLFYFWGYVLNIDKLNDFIFGDLVWISIALWESCWRYYLYSNNSVRS